LSGFAYSTRFARRRPDLNGKRADWKVGSPWKIVAPDGAIIDSGEVLEIDPPKHLVLKWRNEYKPEAKAEGYARMTCTLEPRGDMVKFAGLHEMDRTQSVFISKSPTAGRSSSPASRPCSKPANRWPRRANGSRERRWTGGNGENGGGC